MAVGDRERGKARQPLRVGAVARTFLWLRIQADAFRYDPIGYVQALGWRIRGLRVRARNRIAPLAGRSPLAYTYWIAQHEPVLRAEAGSVAACQCPIVPVIDCLDGSDGLKSSLESLPPRSNPVIVGEGVFAGLRSVARPAELASMLSGGKAWICPLACGDRLAPGALETYGKVAAEAAHAKLIYADDDLINSAGVRSDPHFKPDWNPELFEWHDFVTGACVVLATRDVIAKFPDTGWTAALVRTALHQAVAPVHVRQVLHHRSWRPEPVVPSIAKVEALRDALAVTVIIPTRNRVELLRNCIKGFSSTDYPNSDIIVVDNGSDDAQTLAYLDELRQQRVTVIRAGGPFNFSALNNFAVRQAPGQLLCFLNNDVEMVHPEWLSLLVRQAVRPDIGAVGARLIYPDGTLQHAGVFTGIGGGAGHAHRHQLHDEPGYFERSRLPQRVSAVTGACLVVAKDKFEQVGGFDEEQFPIAFNDIDLCLKLNARGWQSFYEPRATLIHHESKSRGSDRLRHNRARFAGELAALKRKWGTDSKTDPYHHPNLSPFSEQFVISV